MPQRRVVITLKRPSDHVGLRLATASGTMKDYAGKIGTAVVLSKSEIRMPADASPTATSEAKHETNQIVQKYLASNGDKAAFKSVAAAYVIDRKA